MNSCIKCVPNQLGTVGTWPRQESRGKHALSLQIQVMTFVAPQSVVKFILH